MELRLDGRTICRIGLRLRIGLLLGSTALLVSPALLTTEAPEAATAKPITGKLSKSGYTVIALAPSGRARSVRASGRSFRVVPPASSVTLHLRGSDGRYAGPIVVGTKGKQAIVGVRAGAKLGTVSIRAGYARVAKRLPKRFVDTRRLARAKKGVPIGARVFGRVVSRPSRAGAAAGLDRDVDGVPNTLDIDDDGDRILDNFDRQATGRALSLSQTGEQPSLFFFHSLVLPLSETVNVHAGGVTAERIDTVLSTRGMLSVFKLPAEARELDCRGLVYCTAGGTGRIYAGGFRTGERFPECCDPDGDGFGTIESGNAHFFFLSHGATSAQIRTGDVLIERVTTGSVESEFPTTLQGVIATVPALVSYSDGQGNATTITYPTVHRSYPVKAAPGGDVVVSVTLWRPQRRPIPPETADWIDIGGLTYQVYAGCRPTGCLPERCSQDAYSTADPNLRPASLPAYMDGALSDSASDRPASATNTLTFSINLTRCLAVNGLTWAPGEVVNFNFGAFTHRPIGPPTGEAITDLVEQHVHFKLE